MIYGLMILAGMLVTLLGAIGLKNDMQFRLTLSEARALNMFTLESLKADKDKLTQEVESLSESSRNEKEALHNVDVCMQQVSSIRAEADSKDSEILALKDNLAKSWRETDRAKKTSYSTGINQSLGVKPVTKDIPQLVIPVGARPSAEATQ